MHKKIVDSATLTCPNCSSQTQVAMPMNACVVFWVCPQCKLELQPKTGDCCIFCSYGDTPCPPIQAMARDYRQCG